MRKLFFVGMVIAIVFVLFAHSVAAAETSGGFDFNIDGGAVTVSGTYGAYKLASMQVIYCGFPEITTTAGYEEKYNEAKRNPLVFYHYDQKLTDSNGNYTFRFHQSGDSGLYAVRLALEGETSIRYSLYLYVDEVEVNGALKDINDATQTSLKSKIEEVGYLLNVNFEEYNKLNAAKVCEILFANREKLTGKKFANSTEFTNAFKLALLLERVNEATKGIQTLLETNTAINLKTSAAYQTYLGSSHKQDITDAVAKRSNYVFAEDLLLEFCDQTILVSIAKVSNWSEVVDIIDDNQAYLESKGFDFTDFADDTIKKAVCQALAGISQPDIGSLKTAFATSVALAKRSGSTGGGGGGGGGGNEKNVMVSVSPELLMDAISQPLSIFTDLGGVDWAKDAINELAVRGVLSGDGDKNFKPNEPITREQFAKMLIGAFGLVEEGITAEFSDVSTGEWYYSYIACAVKNGIVSGKGDGTFGIGESITRQDMAVMAYRIAQAKGLALSDQKPNVFADQDQISEYAFEAVGIMQATGVINGVGGNLFDAGGIATRAQAAVIIYQLMKL